jgi:hypothetical protein
MDELKTLFNFSIAVLKFIDKSFGQILIGILSFGAALITAYFSKKLADRSKELNMITKEMVKVNNKLADIEQERHQAEKHGEVILSGFKFINIELEDMKDSDQFYLILRYELKITNIGKREIQKIYLRRYIYSNSIFDESLITCLVSKEEWKEEKNYIIGIYPKDLKEILKKEYLDYFIDNKLFTISLVLSSGYVNLFNSIDDRKKSEKEQEFIEKASNINIILQIIYPQESNGIKKEYKIKYCMNLRKLEIDGPIISNTDYPPKNTTDGNQTDAKTDSPNPRQEI